MRRIIRLAIGVKIEEKCQEVDSDTQKKAVSESIWRHGICLINDKKIECSRCKGLDGYLYKIGDSLIETSQVEAFNATEYIDWRDDQ